MMNSSSEQNILNSGDGKKNVKPSNCGSVGSALGSPSYRTATDTVGDQQQQLLVLQQHHDAGTSPASRPPELHYHHRNKQHDQEQLTPLTHTRPADIGENFVSLSHRSMEGKFVSGFAEAFGLQERAESVCSSVGASDCNDSRRVNFCHESKSGKDDVSSGLPHISQDHSSVDSKLFVSTEIEQSKNMLDVAERKSDSEVVLKLFNENVMELDMAKLMSGQPDLVATNDDKHSNMYSLSGSKKGNVMMPCVELKMFEDVEGSSGGLDAATQLGGVMAAGSAAVIRLGASCDDTMLWTCSYCGLTLSSSEQEAQSHINQCGGDVRTFAQNFQQTNTFPVQYKTRPGIYSDKCELITHDIDERGLVNSTNLNNTALDADDKNMNMTLTFSEDPEDHKSMEKHSDGFSTVEKYWKCPVCGVELVDSLAAHLMHHSRAELTNALVNLTETHYRTVADSTAPLLSEQVSKQQSSESNSDVLIISELLTHPSKIEISDQNVDKLEEMYHEQQENTIFDSKKVIHRQGKKGRAHCRKDTTQELSGGVGKSAGGVRRGRKNVTTTAEGDGKKGGNRTTKRWSSRTPHPCPVCGKVLSSRGNVSKHITLHSSSKPWNCSFCSLGFNSQRDWQHHHQQNHSSERSYVCPVCSKDFAVHANLKEHMLFHGVKDKSCDLCGKMFWTQKCVTRHRKRHFPDKKHRCSLCSKSFAVKWDYTLHCRKLHGVAS